jgi:hypothetical protein
VSQFKDGDLKQAAHHTYHFVELGRLKFAIRNKIKCKPGLARLILDSFRQDMLNFIFVRCERLNSWNEIRIPPALR